MNLLVCQWARVFLRMRDVTQIRVHVCHSFLFFKRSAIVPLHGEMLPWLSERSCRVRAQSLLSFPGAICGLFQGAARIRHDVVTEDSLAVGSRPSATTNMGAIFFSDWAFTGISISLTVSVCLFLCLAGGAASTPDAQMSKIKRENVRTASSRHAAWGQCDFFLLN